MVCNCGKGLFLLLCCFLFVDWLFFWFEYVCFILLNDYDDDCNLRCLYEIISIFDVRDFFVIKER